MKVSDYIVSKGLTVRLVAQQAKIQRQTIYYYGTEYEPTVRSLNKIAQAMTELGVPTTVKDLVAATYDALNEA